MSEDALSPQDRQVLEIVREVASEPLEAGRAHLDIDDRGWFTLTPTNPDACRVAIAGSECDLLLGPEGWCHELYYLKERERLHQLRICLVAVITGHYEEVYRKGWLFTYNAGIFHTSEGQIEFRHHAIHEKYEGRRDHRIFAAY